jgi:hypothetical protein
MVNTSRVAPVIHCGREAIDQTQAPVDFPQEQNASVARGAGSVERHRNSPAADGKQVQLSGTLCHVAGASASRILCVFDTARIAELRVTRFFVLAALHE